MADKNFKSDAREVDAPTLLRSAARLIERALLKLDSSFTPCSECGRKKHRNMEQAMAYERFSDLPDRLTREANKLEGKDSDLLPGMTRRKQ